MAYDPDVPPSLITQAIGGPAGMRWFALTWIDPIADLLVAGYISNAFDIGLRPGDGLIYKDVNRGEWDSYSLICLSVDENGTATMAFPEVPEEAVPFVETVDFNDSGTYVVIYQGGRQSRTEIINFAIDTISNASQAEAEAGVVNDKRMTPLRTKQAITAQALSNPVFTGNPQAPTPSPSDNDTSIATTGFVKAAIDVVLGGVSAAFDTLAELAAAVLDRVAYSAQSKTSTEQAQARSNIGMDIGYPMLHLQEQQASGTPAGASISGSNTRNLNAVVRNEISGASLAANIVTLPIGTYWVEGYALAYKADRHKLALIKISGGTVAVVGAPGYASVDGDQQDRAVLGDRLVVATAGTYRLDHSIAAARSIDGQGVSGTAFGVDAFSELKIWKLK